MDEKVVDASVRGMAAMGQRWRVLAMLALLAGCAEESAGPETTDVLPGPVMAPAGVGASGVGAAGGDGATAGTLGTGAAGTLSTPGVAGQASNAGAAGVMAGGRAGSAGEAGASAGVDAGSAGMPDGGMGGDASMENADAGTGAPSAFSPCPPSEPCRVLPLGDSITDGIGFSGGYRVELFRAALTDGKRITFVGGSANGPSMVDGEPFPRNHEGHSGWTIAQIDGIVPDPALAADPHIVLLHIGTNDMVRSAAGAPDRLEALIDQIVAELPDALVVVSTIIPLSFSSGAVESFNAAIPPLIEARAAEGKHVMLVDQFEGFPTSELGDGVHPNQQGYARMAGVWYEAIRDALP